MSEQTLSKLLADKEWDEVRQTYIPTNIRFTGPSRYVLFSNVLLNQSPPFVPKRIGFQFEFQDMTLKVAGWDNAGTWLIEVVALPSERNT